ncbi:conserved hypothetical protein [Klebsiella quasipneumoniae subsp. similipneumoniae]|nr:conserved hypothetical protein [Klebsiella quasipneumoniae subsp. similipneumoniae]
MRMADQLSGEKIQLAGSDLYLRRVRYRPVMNAPHKARVAQAQHRHQTHQVSGQLIDILQRQRFAFAIDKTAQGHHAVVIGEFAFQAVEHPVIAIITGHPTALKRTETPYPMAPRLGFTKGQNNMQMVLASLDVARGEPEVIANKVIKIELWRQKQGQRIKQTGLPPRVLPDQDVILLQHQRQTIDTAKTDDFYALKKHIPSATPPLSFSNQQYSEGGGKMTLRLITSAHPILEIKYIHKITHLSSINGY